MIKINKSKNTAQEVWGIGASCFVNLCCSKCFCQVSVKIFENEFNSSQDMSNREICYHGEKSTATYRNSFSFFKQRAHPIDILRDKYLKKWSSQTKSTCKASYLRGVENISLCNLGEWPFNLINSLRHFPVVAKPTMFPALWLRPERWTEERQAVCF